MVDLYAGGGGEHTGIINAFRSRGIDPIHIAVNHWNLAIETLKKNHPDAREYEVRVESLDPTKVVPGRRVNLLWASPSCVFHSRAGGGRSKDDQDRTQPFAILDWLNQLYVERLIVENVTELEKWGPLNSKGKVIKSKKGITFNAWIAAIRSLGYTVDWRVLNCADFGVPQARERLFVQAVRGKAKISWPNPTHSKEGGGLFDLQKWRGADQCIDWSIPHKPIHLRPKPLVENTIKRIMGGIKKHWKVDPEPFMVYLRGTSEAQLRSSSAPINLPLRTVSAGGRHAALVEPLFFPQHSCGTPKKVGIPLSTITTTGAIGLLEPLLVQYQTKGGSRPVSMPMTTLTTKGKHALLEPLLVKYYGTGICQPVSDPISTLTTKGRHGLLEASLIGLSYRMLDDSELSLCQGFPDDYWFAGKKTARIKQIGNAVPPPVAEALVGAGLDSQRKKA